MQNAAQACLEVLWEKIATLSEPKVCVVCGSGNNGGDGFALAQMLRLRGVETQVVFTGDIDNISPEARYFLNGLDPAPVPLQTLQQIKSFLKRKRNSYQVWVDALLGTGLNRELSLNYRALIRGINAAHGWKFAVDMPSGVSGDTGEVMGDAFNADVTVSFEVPKVGQVRAPGWDYVGDLKIRPIGLSSTVLKKIARSAPEWIISQTIIPWFTSRRPNTHKGNYGRVLVIAGSVTMPGAGYLSSLAALRIGSGRVTWALPEELLQRMNLDLPEVMLQPLPSHKGGFAPLEFSQLKNLFKNFEVMVLGPGWGRNSETAKFLKQIFEIPSKIVKIFDADALNLLAENRSLLKLVSGAVLTPHPLEMSRLTDLEVENILRDREGVASRFAKRYGVWLVLKGYRTVIASPQGQVFLNSSGGANLAVPGSGDVLAGILAGLIAQGFSLSSALLAGVFLHGASGDMLKDKIGDRGVLASEIANGLPILLQRLLREKLKKTK